MVPESSAGWTVSTVQQHRANNARYGIRETGFDIDELPDELRPTYRGGKARYEKTVVVTDPGLDRIIRLRLLSERSYPVWDVSYCWGQMKDGTLVRVSLPGLFIERSPRISIAAQIVEYAKREGFSAKRLGLLDPLIRSCLYV